VVTRRASQWDGSRAAHSDTQPFGAPGTATTADKARCTR